MFFITQVDLKCTVPKTTDLAAKPTGHDSDICQMAGFTPFARNFSTIKFPIALPWL
jgi:hypothetical protein